MAANKSPLPTCRLSRPACSENRRADKLTPGLFCQRFERDNTHQAARLCNNCPRQSASLNGNEPQPPPDTFRGPCQLSVPCLPREPERPQVRSLQRDPPPPVARNHRTLENILDIEVGASERGLSLVTPHDLRGDRPLRPSRLVCRGHDRLHNRTTPKLSTAVGFGEGDNALPSIRRMGVVDNDFDIGAVINRL